MKRILDLQRSAGGHRILDAQNAVEDAVIVPPVGQTVSDADFAAWLESDDALPNMLIRATALVNGVETVFRWSTLGVTFGGVEAPLFYDPVVSVGIPLSESLSLTGGASVSAGDLEIDNADGVNQYLLNYDWRDQAIEALEGDIRWNEADYRVFYRGISGGMSPKDDRTLALYQLDMSERLNTALTERRLGGDGPDQDAIYPTAFGEIHNATGLLVDENLLRRAFHDGEIEGVRMRTNAIPTYDFDVDYAAGTVDLGINNASAAITASIQGDRFGGVYRKTIASIVRRIVTGFGDAAKRYTDADIDLANFAAFDAAHQDLVGVFNGDGVNVLDVCDSLAASLGAQVVPSIDGKLRVIQIAIPASGTSMEIMPEHIKQGSLRAVQHIPRVAGIKLGFCRNYTVQTGLQSLIPDEHLALFAKEWLSVTVGAGDPEQINTMLQRRVDALPEATRRLALWGVDRDVFEFIGLGPMTKLKLGQPVRLTYDLFGMQEGVDGQVLYLAPDRKNRQVTVRVLV